MFLFDGKLEFAYPGFLYLLIPAVLLLFLRRREGARGAIAYSSLFLLHKLGRRPGGRIGLLSLVLFFLALASGIIALARPQIVNQLDYTTSSGVDIVIAFDLSGSMTTTDMQINGRAATRLDVAKAVITDFVGKRSNDRIGIVGFAGRPKMFSPLTLDHNIVQDHITRFSPSLISAPGTAVGSAIAAASSRLEERKDTKSKVIILVTDGASNVGALSPMEAATLAHKLNIKIYTVAVGTSRGLSIKDMGEEFDEETLKAISKLTGGEHFRAKDTQMFIDAFDSIDRLEKSEVKKQTIRREKEMFPWLVALAAALTSLGAIIEILRPRPSP